MTWFKVDDGLSTHRKVDALGASQPIALACWVMLGSACARDLTDGLVTPAALCRTLAMWSERDRLKAAEALVRVGLWVENTGPDGGWLFHGWHLHQPSRAAVEAQRDAQKERQRRSRDARVTRDKPVTHAVTDAVVTQSVTSDKSVSHTTPTRPVPSRPVPSSVGEARSADTHPHHTWLLALYGSWRALTGAVPGTGSAEKLAHAWDDPWRLTPQERSTLERAQAVHGVFGDDLEALRRAVTAFGADDYARKKGLPFALFASQAATYATKREHAAGVSDFSHVPDGEAF